VITRRASSGSSVCALLILVAGLLSAFRLATIAADETPPGDVHEKTPATAATSANLASSTGPQDNSGKPTAAKPLVRLTKTTPTSVADLAVIQAGIQQAAAKGVPATVGISIGGAFGSGVIVTEDGYVLTAGHVVGWPGRDATIIFPDGKHVKATTLGVNRDMDSGMLKITVDAKYPYVELGHSSDLKQGDWCVTLGHPGGFIRDRSPVVRAGRVLTAPDGFVNKDAIRTDCTIVGGDSGGPLLDTAGRLIGIHSRISDDVTDNYHVPIDTFRDTWNRLAKGDTWGKEQVPTGPLLGINGQDVDAGCKVTDVFPGTPAARIGLARDDIVVSFGGESINGLARLKKLIAKHEAGDEVPLVIERAGEKKEMKVKLAEREGD
jgi:serine protease Do